MVGRDAGCDRVIDLPMISGRHARLSRPAGTILIEEPRLVQRHVRQRAAGRSAHAGEAGGPDRPGEP